MSKLSQALLSRFAGRRVVIAGDVVADQFLYGTISRVSREAPVFILNHDETDTRPGGAANAAANVAALGGRPVIVGFTGDDSNGKTLLAALADAGVDCGSIISDRRLQTTTKVRVLAGQEYALRQQVIRIDYAGKRSIPNDVQSQLAEKFALACDGAEAIIVSDYNYGAASDSIFEIAQRKAKDLGIPLVIDSRFRLSEFHGATAGTPNQEEVEQILGRNPGESECDQLRETLGYKALLVTRGNKGMTLYEDRVEPRHFDAIGSKEPVDVTGAGDTVIGTFALGLASGLSFADAAEIANHAGGIVVMKRGTAVATSGELLQSLENLSEDLKLATPTR